MKIYKKIRKATELLLQVLFSLFSKRIYEIHSFIPTPLKLERPCLSSNDANEVIRQCIEGKNSCMIGRFGSVELNAVLRASQYSKLNKSETLLEELIQKNKLFSEKAFRLLKSNAGFFPINKLQLTNFVKIMIEAMSEVDILGSWVNGENYFSRELANSRICNLEDIEPYYHENPWTMALKEKKVLVVHPFTDSIEIQYQKRDFLFKDGNVLPPFTLITYRAVQTIAGNTMEYASWFDAFAKMAIDIKKIDFDIAILGCGAYGFPLAAMIKKSGKKAIHLGGATQILFGIKGARWDSHPIISKLYNEYWIRPSIKEKPKNVEIVEGACYW